MSLRRTLILSFLGGIFLTFATSWLLATRALDTPSPGRSAFRLTGAATWKDVARYDRFGSVDVRCLASDSAYGHAVVTSDSPDDLAPAWMRPMLVPWGWDAAPPANSFSVRTVKVSGWPLPCLYAVYEAVPNPAVWPHRAISGLVLSDSWTGFGPQYPGEMPVAFPYRPRALPFLINVAFYSLVVLVLILLVGPVRRARRRKRGLCERCRYDLRGLKAGSACPECGLKSAGLPIS